MGLLAFTHSWHTKRRRADPTLAALSWPRSTMQAAFSRRILQHSDHAEPKKQGGGGENHELTKDDFAKEIFQDEHALGRGGHDSTWVLNPESQVCKRLDVAVFVALFFTAIVTPYEVALLETKANTRFWVNCVVDIVYLTDLFRNFFP